METQGKWHQDHTEVDGEDGTAHDQAKTHILVSEFGELHHQDTFYIIPIISIISNSFFCLQN